jgi:hypothetical protein
MLGNIFSSSNILYDVPWYMLIILELAYHLFLYS